MFLMRFLVSSRVSLQGRIDFSCLDDSAQRQGLCLSPARKVSECLRASRYRTWVDWGLVWTRLSHPSFRTYRSCCLLLLLLLFLPAADTLSQTNTYCRLLSPITFSSTQFIVFRLHRRGRNKNKPKKEKSTGLKRDANKVVCSAITMQREPLLLPCQFVDIRCLVVRITTYVCISVGSRTSMLSSWLLY